ncbi:carbohydrate binding domain-containing protein [Marinicrinis sediminis]|uniref:Carbohydrate binding domain-containing protein n=1 Tax=Marinicrinis sediminis TaxID=1652465 RepID=A0ABW5R7M5_9BACL
MRKKRRIQTALLLLLSLMLMVPAMGLQSASAEIAASHVYHNHMPNFWAYYDTGQYASTPVGAPIRYTYDGQVIELKNNPPSNYTYFLPNGSPMPHDDLTSYYSHHAKTGAYLDWPWNVAGALDQNHPQAQMHVTMSGSVVTNVNDLMYHGNVPGYANPNWGTPWKNAYNNLRTTNNQRTLDLIHFTGHHSMGPLVGNDYMLKDLIYQSAVLAQPYFMGNDFKSSKGFFPTELGFSERIIPVLEKLDIEWSVIGNNHFSRTLRDYPYLNNPGVDTLVSPPNRADMQNVSNVGSWVSQPMFNEQQVVRNKFPFASTPHWVKYVNPETGQESKIVGIPVAQAESWEEGYQGSVTASALKPFEGLVPQKQFFVIAHDGDNSSGRAGSEETWRNAGNVTYADSGVKGMGIDEYLLQHTPPASDVVHVQDGSWIDTRDSSSDPQWHHWKLPFGIWKGQFADFNQVMGTNYAPKTNIFGQEEGMTVSFEYGYHYLERNFALLQAALNYAQTAEQIWLDGHPNHWQPTTALDQEITHTGNQLNPWMMSFPVKGNEAMDYAGGANPAELSWYFLLPALDSGFGYYDENQDDHVKPTLSFNQSLHFSKPYVNARLNQDDTGPSVWWPQRWPYNPGSANKDKSQGWTLHYYDNSFAVYTYAYDVNGIQSIKLKMRTHQGQWADTADNTFRVYDPAALAAQGVPNITPSKVGNWTEYNMNVRDLTPDMNGVDWQSATKQTMQVLPAQEIGDLYYTYIDDYQNEMVDYYIEAVDSKGNVTKSDIQTVFVGAGQYREEADGTIVEDMNGPIQGTYPFVTDTPPVVDTTPPTVPAGITSPSQTKSTITLNWTPSTDDVGVAGYHIYRNGSQVGSSTTPSFTDSGLTALTAYTYKVSAYDAKGNESAQSSSVSFSTNNQGNEVTVYYKKGFSNPYMHYRPAGGTWTVAPGVQMPNAEVSGYGKLTIDIGSASALEAVFNNGSGTWDNNGGQNYLFNPGTWTFNAGTITAGAPATDTTAPSVPAGLQASAQSSTAIQLSWNAATDNVGVQGYKVYRGGSQIATVSGTSYTDTGLSAGTSYSYTVKAYDAAGNESASSSTATATTSAQGSQVTVYYKKGFSTPYMHYRPAGGTWTAVPGVQMPASEVSGYTKLTVDIGSSSSLEAVFNDGGGTWDNNGGQNYNFNPGTWTFDGGTITAGAPSPVTQVSVTFQVTVPGNTPAAGPVYMATSLGSWNPAAPAYQLTKQGNGTYAITLTAAPGTQMQYKLTRGSWGTVEVNSNGSDITDRSYTFPTSSATLSLNVQRWKDL